MELELTNKKWKEFLIGNLFTISTGALLPKKQLKKGNIPRITATDLNNGVYDYYTELEHKNHRTESNFISVSFLGSVFYHPYKASLDMKIHSVKLKEMEFNKYLAQFIVLALKRTTSLFSYGDQLSSSDLPKKKILLPVNEKEEPDFKFMELFIKHKEQQKLNTFESHINKRINEVKNFKEVSSLDETKWGEFEIGKLFKLNAGKSKGLNHLTKDKTGVNYLGATNSNNGVLAYVKIEGNEKMVQQGNCIAFIRNGEGSMGF
ncbi:restriction endonuclease subunit S [Polaribacter atrinae]|uniref:restriction endonuclease subunit S n=1 Tax=Polaribacter atrinae TaxID=1333662 RepID=UPI0030F5132D